MIKRSALVVALTLVACSSPPAAAPAAAPPATASTSAPEAASADAGVSSAPTAQAAQPGPSSSAAPPVDVPGTPRERLMRSHFKEAGLIRTAVLNGALSDAAAPAEALAKMEGLGKIEPGWQSSIDVLQYASKRISHSSDIPAVAAAVADIGIACGACHKVAGGPKVKVGSPPTTDASLASRMRRHVWATERLWEGIFVPSDESWKAGAAALSGDPFPREVLDKGGVHARSAAARFRSLVTKAASKNKPAERGQLYAAMLETCSACHVATRNAK